MQQQRQPSQRDTWVKILDKVRDEILKPALQKSNIGLDQVRETRFRWDALDITLSWPEANPNRNVHAWLSDMWPLYRLTFEGAAWEDNWQESRRRVVFLKGPRGIVELSPPWNSPKVEILRVDELSEAVGRLVDQVASADPSKEEWEYKLQPNPQQTDLSRGQRG